MAASALRAFRAVTAELAAARGTAMTSDNLPVPGLERRCAAEIVGRNIVNVRR